MEEQTTPTDAQTETTAPVTTPPTAEPQQKTVSPAPKHQKADGDVAVSKPSPQKTVWATGRRKTSVAQVRMVPSKNGGKILVNKKSVEQYFHGMEKLTMNALESLRAAKFPGSYDFYIKVQGGGIHGQSDAIRHAIARAVSQLDPKIRQLMRKEGYLTRDPRVVERKKSGQPKARKRFQYSKR